jgi:PIN domain nuclease of toxin-antitoxin system
LRLLVDTNVFLWLLHEPGRVAAPAHAALADPANDVYLSAVVPWEIAIKLPTGKLQAPPNLGAWITPALVRFRFEPLAVAFHHVVAVEQLSRHHSDPFDRLLIAQAQVEGLILATGDPQLQAYPVPLLPCWR